MTKQELVIHMEKIEASFRQKFADQELRLWIKYFTDKPLITDKRFGKAVDKLILNEKYFPFISTMNNYVTATPSGFTASEEMRLYYEQASKDIEK